MEDPKPSPYSQEGGSRKTTLEIGTDGIVRMVYSDDLWAFAERIGGDMKATCRASNVEWETVSRIRTSQDHDAPHDLNGWVIRAAHDKELAIRMKDKDSGTDEVVCSRDPNLELAVYENRKTAIEVEIQFFHELLPPHEGT